MRLPTEQGVKTTVAMDGVGLAIVFGGRNSLDESRIQKLGEEASCSISLQKTAEKNKHTKHSAFIQKDRGILGA